MPRTLFLAFFSAAAARPHPYQRIYGRPGALLAGGAAPPPLPPAPAAAPSAWCLPTDPCWPSPAQWAAFNATLGGALIAVAPPLAPCFPYNGAPPNGALCNALLANYTNSYLRASLPGASQEVNWEQDPVSGEDCFDAAKPCMLGNIPPFAVPVASEEMVSTALAFASAHSLRVVIKSSGHEYQGRSAGGGALLLWTHALRGARYEPSFAACPATPRAPAFTTSPGTSWGEVCRAADAARVTVVGGSEISVSSCGGYTFGGGHSWMGPAYGMAVDNLLSVRLVLANGSAVTASACENPDLFWALRGGGGGTFGVATQCAYAAHPFPAAGAAGAFITVELLQGNASFAVLLDGWLAQVGALGDPAANGVGVVAGGYFIPTFDAPEGTHEHMSFLIGVNGTVDQAKALFGPLAAWVATVPQHLSIIGADFIPFPSLMAFHEYYDANSEATGYAGTLGSRVLPLALLADGAARAAVAEALTAIAYTTGGLTGMLVAGGAVGAGDAASGALHPGWRGAGAHLAWGASWPLNSSLAVQGAIFAGVSQLTQLVRDLAPGSAAYWSESE